MLLHTVRKEKRAGEGVCVCVSSGGDTYSSGFLDLQLPKVEWSSQYFWSHKSDAHNLSDRGLPKALSTVSRRLSVSSAWDNTLAVWESWWTETHASSSVRIQPGTSVASLCPQYFLLPSFSNKVMKT